MIDLLKQADPAIEAEVDVAGLRAMVDERVGLTPPLQRLPSPTRRPWLMAAASFALVIVVAVIVSALRQPPQVFFGPPVESLGNLPGIETIVPLASGGVQTMAVDGDTIWVMTALAHELQRISADHRASRTDIHHRWLCRGGRRWWRVRLVEEL